MIARVLGAVACGACAASAFTLPIAVRSASRSHDARSQRWTTVPRQSRMMHQEHLHQGEAKPLSMAHGEGGDGAQRSRREVIAGLGKAMAGAVALASIGSVAPKEAEALGPIKILLTDPEYHSVTCPPKTQVPGEKAGAGLKPVCVKVTVTAINPNKKEIPDAAVFGFVLDEDNTSVVANNPDGASDAGQFAIIDMIPLGTSRVSFQFVAAIEPKEDFDLKKLKFKSLKAISYPGGQQYGAITECEMNPLAEECNFD